MRVVVFFAAAAAFAPAPARRTPARPRMLPPNPGNMSPEQMAQAAEALKTLKPEQIGQMLEEFESMGPEERARMKQMGINPDMLKMSMKVMKANPNIIRMAQDQMSKMSPEQMKQASDLAQKQMEAMSPQDLEKMADQAIAGSGVPPPPAVVDVPVAPAADAAPARDARDEALVDALFVVGAAMSKVPGAVTLEAFKQLPPIVSLMGDLPDDLTDGEIADCWAEAGLAVGAAADKTAFTKAWLAVDLLYDDDLMVEARRPPKKTRRDD